MRIINYEESGSDSARTQKAYDELDPIDSASEGKQRRQ
jgi:hypothetical protein